MGYIQTTLQPPRRTLPLLRQSSLLYVISKLCVFAICDSILDRYTTLLHAKRTLDQQERLAIATCERGV